MILVDTSAWIAFFRRTARDAEEARCKSIVEAALRDGAPRLAIHEFARGELVLGNNPDPGDYDWVRVFEPEPGAATRAFVRSARAAGLELAGLGWVDVHIASTAVKVGCDLLTPDRRVRAFYEAAAARLAPNP